MSAWTGKHFSEAFSNYDDSLEQKFGFPAVCAQFSSLSLGATIIDYGCGAVALARHLLNMQANVVGVDISGFALKMARNNIRDIRASFFHPEALPPDIIF